MTETVNRIDMNEAYKIMKIRESASRDEISQKYYIIMKKFRASSAEEIDGQTLDSITKAYNLLMGYEDVLPEEGIEKKESSGWISRLLKKVGIDSKKTANFFHYYKWHVLIVAFIVIGISLSVRGCLMRIPPDFKMAFIGNYYLSDTDKFKEEIKVRYPGIKEIQIEMVTLSDTLDAQQTNVMEMKAVALFAAENIDIFIVDEESFERFGKQGVFMPMTSIMKSATIPLDDERVIKASWDFEASDPNLAENGVEEIYGFNVTGNPIFAETEVYGDEYIFAVGIRSEYRPRVVWMLHLLSEFE